MLNKIKKVLSVVILSASFLFLAANGPRFHANVIRHYVGTKTVKITGRQGDGGTGFFVKAPSGLVYILTNRHVCAVADKDGYLRVYTADGATFISRKVDTISETHDLCLIKTIEGYDGIDIASSISIGEIIGIVGHPKLQPLTLSKGEYIGDKIIKLISGYNLVDPRKCRGEIISNPMMRLLGIKNACLEELTASQLVAYTRGGSSGSPVVNFWGKVVGVLFAGNPQDVMESFAVPLKEIKEFLKNE